MRQVMGERVASGQREYSVRTFVTSDGTMIRVTVPSGTPVIVEQLAGTEALEAIEKEARVKG